MNYRDRIYSQYATNFQDATDTVNIVKIERWGRAYPYYFRRWLPECKDSPIVEVACGGGALLHLFSRLGYADVTGVDVSPQQIRLASQITPRVVLSDAVDFLRTKDSQFALVVALDLVEHFTKDEVLAFLDACYGSLRLGGRLILQTPNLDSPWGGSQRYNDFTHEVGFNPNSLSRMIRLAGFTAVQCREQGPVPFGYSALSTIRFALWQSLRMGAMAWNLIETGDAGSKILTRVFLVSGTKA